MCTGVTVITGAPVTSNVNCFSAHPQPSDARNVKLNWPVCTGAPEKYPNRES
jgi:hypothetical protein